MQLGILLFLAAFPILELALLIKFGQSFGFWATLGLILSTGVAGLIVLQAQGLAMMARLRDILVGGRPPPDLDFEGGLMLLAGTMLLLPGPMTDLCGVALLIPPIRAAAARWLRDRIQVYTVHREEPAQNGAPPGDGPIIDGEFQRIDERPTRPNRDDAHPPRP